MPQTKISFNLIVVTAACLFLIPLYPALSQASPYDYDQFDIDLMLGVLYSSISSQDSTRPMTVDGFFQYLNNDPVQKKAEKSDAQPPTVIPPQSSIQSEISIVSGDSMLLSVYSGIDSTIFRWYLNDILYDELSDSVYLYRADSARIGPDTVSVLLLRSPLDTVAVRQWIITVDAPVAAIEPAFEYLFTPEADLTLQPGDSLLLRASTTDSVTFEWYVNGIWYDELNDSVYLYRADSARVGADTVSVLLLRSPLDTVAVRQWIIAVDAPVVEVGPAYEYLFTPEADLTLQPGDSLLLRASTTDSVTFEWYVNGQQITDALDSLFRYISIGSEDTVDVILRSTLFDTTVSSHRWVMQPVITEQQDSDDSVRFYLSAPIPMFPMDQGLARDEKFIWKSDSGNASYNYLVQVAADTSFGTVICSDSCYADTTLRLADLNCFDDLIVGQDYYWRVKILDKDSAASDFSKSGMRFYLIPSNTELVYFTANEDISGSIVLSWEAEHEYLVRGYNIYRREAESAQYEKLNEMIIEGERSYFFDDPDVTRSVAYQYRLEVITIDGTSRVLADISVNVSSPEKYGLYPNYPNPFNAHTIFKYQIPVETHVVVEIFNLLGRRIRTLVNDNKSPGSYSVSWDGFDDEGVPVVSGIYFYHLSTRGFKDTRRMTVVR
ncbi:MAG: T9SS type A sorting domain-containing protein [candidate division KSB1 bacterium]|nr:T9SS type A sorting domain-containing protein [candidate division KSB1 bacterium]